MVTAAEHGGVPGQPTTAGEAGPSCAGADSSSGDATPPSDGAGTHRDAEEGAAQASGSKRYRGKD
eukprot:4263771-Prymnesium_polylepis.1